MFVSSTISCIISRKRSMKMLSGEESLFMLGSSFCLTPLGPPVNLCITGAESRNFVMSIYSVQPVSFLLFSSVFLSL
jgi:hypothetical protein